MSKGDGVVVVVALLCIIIVSLVLSGGIYYTKKFNDCKKQESPYCFNITCPADDPSSTCGGYAMRPSDKDGYVYCSYAPNSLVPIN